MRVAHRQQDRRETSICVCTYRRVNMSEGVSKMRAHTHTCTHTHTHTGHLFASILWLSVFAAIACVGVGESICARLCVCVMN